MLETPVLIIGAGPVGQMAALLLSQAGIPSLIVERRVERMTAPKAHAVNARTLEICERAGLSAERVRATGAPPDEAGWVRFMSCLNGVEFGHLPYERQQADVRALTPFPLRNIAQPDFEALLAQQLETRENVSVLRGATCTALNDQGDHVTAKIALRGSAAPLMVKSRYVLAADGASSRTRDQLGIALEGPTDLQHNMMIHFEADLRHLTKARPGILYFLLDPDRSGALIAYDHGKTWVLMHGFNPATAEAAAFNEAECAALVERAVGQAVPDLKICNVGPWTMSAQVAERYRQGNVFLMGDAAHRFPPTGGLGLNTGIGDAQNICWKLAAVLQGQADDELLETYDVERRPIAKTNSEQSLENAGRMFELFAALYGPDPAQASSYFSALCETAGATPEVAKAVEFQRPHFDSFNLQQGYRYHSTALYGSIPVDTAEIDISAYEPCALVGEHVPHIWMNAGDEQVPLLSALPMDQFTLIAGPADTDWGSQATRISPPLNVLKWSRDICPTSSDWQDFARLPDDGALLLRPDGHIAARLDPRQGDAMPILPSLMDQILHRHSTGA